MKYAVLGFSYSNFTHFEDHIQSRGYYTSNLGDSAQTVSARYALASCGVSEADIVEIDRDTLPSYVGPPARLLMNGVFARWSLPAPASIQPIFLGFNSDAQTIASNADWLKRWAPIGCRDHNTARLCGDHGIEAFVTGCVTMTLPRRTSAPSHGRLHIVLGWDRLLPPGILKHVPHHLLDGAVISSNRRPEMNLPLTLEERTFNQRLVASTLRHYQDEASLVLTPLLHVAAPCVAMGIPTIIARPSDDTRFDILASRMPIYTPDRFPQINWSPDVPDLSDVAVDYMARLQSALAT